MSFYERGTRVEINNPKHKHYGKRGTVTDMDRGNVYVKLDDGTEVCTRMAALKDLGLLDKIAEASANKKKP